MGMEIDASAAMRVLPAASVMGVEMHMEMSAPAEPGGTTTSVVDMEYDMTVTPGS
jgi:hypothetical protein